MTTEGKEAFRRISRGEPRQEKALTSDQEREIIQLVVQGYRDSDIAKRLSINELTVKEELHSIFDKLALTDRLELTLYTIYVRLMDQSNAQQPPEQLSGSSPGCWMRSAWVRLRRKVQEI